VVQSHSAAPVPQDRPLASVLFDFPQIASFFCLHEIQQANSNGPVSTDLTHATFIISFFKITNSDLLLQDADAVLKQNIRIRVSYDAQKSYAYAQKISATQCL
jgi:hypothetical protein